MQIMTSLEAQNHFGEMIDSSQREPVLITRRGRPVSIVISPCGDVNKAMHSFIKALGELSPLRGKEAAHTIERTLSGLGTQANKDGLTEKDVQAMLREP